MDNVKEWNHEGMLPQNISFGEINREIPSFSQNINSLKYTHPVEYLSSIESFVSKELISSQNFAEIKKLASYFTENITSFFGFETRLNALAPRSDYLFAVSSKKGEREALARLLQDENISESFRNKPEWQNVGKFAAEWVNPNSIVYQKVLGLWLEFDTAIAPTETPIPCIFLQTIPLQTDQSGDITSCKWLTQIALPTICGHSLSETMEKRIFECFRQLPPQASVINIGVMLSRSTTGVRLVFNRLQPQQIIPFLNKMGWKDDNEGLSKLLKELEQNVNRIVLHINVTENGIDPKIGLECSFSQDKYHLETRWVKFFDYLIQKGICHPDKKHLLLDFLGVELKDTNQEFSFEKYMIAVKIPEENFSPALTRYLSHVKVCYTPNHPLEAKVYSGIRLFGTPQTSSQDQYA